MPAIRSSVARLPSSLRTASSWEATPHASAPRPWGHAAGAPGSWWAVALVCLLGCGATESSTKAPTVEVTLPAPAAAPPPPRPVKYGPPLDEALIPPGRGWHCFGQSVSLRCSREADACEALLAKTRARDEEDGEETITTEGCLALTGVWCMTFERSNSPAQLGCFTNETTCAEDGSFYRGEAERFAEDGEVPEGSAITTRASGCSRLP